jgi:hypothetical protein
VKFFPVYSYLIVYRSFSGPTFALPRRRRQGMTGILMELLPILYAGAFFLIACSGYLCCSMISKLRECSKQVFVAVLAFGACSYVGFFIIVLAISSTPLDRLLQDNLCQSVTFWPTLFQD